MRSVRNGASLAILTLMADTTHKSAEPIATPRSSLTVIVFGYVGTSRVPFWKAVR